MTIQNHFGAIAILPLISGNALGAQDFDALAEIRKCASIGDAVSRFACYETLGGRATAAHTHEAEDAERPQAVAPPLSDVVESAAGTTVVTTAPEALPDDIGGQEFEQKVEEAKSEEARGMVTSCKRGADKKWYFVFASGQVWKQVDSARLRFDDCNFGATISKDLFGYKMSIDGRVDKIRVSRRR